MCWMCDLDDYNRCLILQLSGKHLDGELHLTVILVCHEATFGDMPDKDRTQAHLKC